MISRTDNDDYLIKSRNYYLNVHRGAESYTVDVRAWYEWSYGAWREGGIIVSLLTFVGNIEGRK